MSNRIRTLIASAFVFFTTFFLGYSVIALASCQVLEMVNENPQAMARELRLAADDIRGIASLSDDPSRSANLELIALYLDDVSVALENALPTEGATAAAREIIRLLMPDVGEDARPILVLADAVLRRIEAYRTPPILD